jgi:hypothetical protein
MAPGCVCERVEAVHVQRVTKYTFEERAPLTCPECLRERLIGAEGARSHHAARLFENVKYHIKMKTYEDKIYYMKTLARAFRSLTDDSPV